MGSMQFSQKRSAVNLYGGPEPVKITVNSFLSRRSIRSNFYFETRTFFATNSASRVF